MAATAVALCYLAALCLVAVARPEYDTAAATRPNVEVTSVAPSQTEQGSHPSGENVIPLLSQFTGQDPLEAESTDEAGASRQKRTFKCKKCGGFGGGYGGGYRTYKVVVPVKVVAVKAVPVRAHPVYYPRRSNYCDPCSRRGYGGGGRGGGGGSYASSFSYSQAYSSGKR